MPDNMLKANNPSNIRAGEECWAVYRPAFHPRTMEMETSGCTEIIHGRLERDYAEKPVGEDVRGPMYFMPDEPLPGTDLISEFYLLANWMAFRSRAEALAGRAMLAKAAIASRRADIKFLEQFL